MTDSEIEMRQQQESVVAYPKESTTSDNEEFVVVSASELIAHLSTEIDTYTKMIFDWRARAAFYWLVGPFVVIGSVVIVTKQVPTLQGLDSTSAVAIGIVCLCFIGMAYIGARMEAHMTNQCNTWRNTILRLTTEEKPKVQKTDVVVLKQRVTLAYMVAHLLLLLAFVCSMFVISHSATSNASVGSGSVQKMESLPTPSASPPGVR